MRGDAAKYVVGNIFTAAWPIEKAVFNDEGHHLGDDTAYEYGVLRKVGVNRWDYTPLITNKLDTPTMIYCDEEVDEYFFDPSWIEPVMARVNVLSVEDVV